METQEKLKNRVLSLNNLMPKSGEYPSVLRESGSLLVEEQPNLIPIYMDGGCVNFLEATIIDKEDDKTMKEIEQAKVTNYINDFRGGISNIVYGMKRYGLRGYPDLMVLTSDLHSSDPAIKDPGIPPFSFEIRPKTFELGLTGRLLEDDEHERYSETLTIDLDIYDAYDFASYISPQRIVAVKHDGKPVTVYENDREVGRQEKLDVGMKGITYVMDEKAKENWACKTKILPVGGLRVVHPDFYERIKKYDNGPIIFGHEFQDIREFLSYVTLTDNHLIWKICKSELGDPNRPLIDAGPYYGLYKGEPRHENTNRLHFMPSKAHLWFDGTMITFDKPQGIQALMSLGDIVRDIWIDAEHFREDGSDHQSWGWDIIHDKSRGITPENPVNVRTNEDYKKYPVLKEQR